MVSAVAGRVKPSGAVGDADWWRRQHARAAARRPRPGGLTVARITEAALDLLASGDLGDLTMRSLAAKLGTQAGSLYRHVASREELLVHVLDAALGGLEPPPPGRRGGRAPRAFSRDHRNAWLRRPALAPLLSEYPMLGPNTMRSREIALSYHMAHGYSPQDASEIYTILTRFVLGSVTRPDRPVAPPAADHRAAPGAVRGTAGGGLPGGRLDGAAVDPADRP